VFTNKKRAGINTFVCAVFLYVAETPKTSIKDHEPVFPITPFGIVACGFVGQPFSKQQYLETDDGNTMGRKDFPPFQSNHLKCSERFVCCQTDFREDRNKTDL